MTNGEESKITIKVWGMVVLLTVIFGFFFVTVLAHESRLMRVETTVEVSLKHMAGSLSDMAGDIKRMQK